MTNPFEKMTQFLGGKKKNTEDTSKVLPFVVPSKGRVQDAQKRLDEIRELEERERERKIPEEIREKYYQEALNGAGAKLTVEKFGTNKEIEQQAQAWRFNVTKQIKDFLLKNSDLKDLLLNSVSTKIKEKDETVKSLEEKIVGIYKTQIEKESALAERKVVNRKP